MLGGYLKQHYTDKKNELNDIIKQNEAEIKEKKPLHGTKDFFRDLFSDLTESEMDDLTKYARFLLYLRTHSEE